MSEPINEDIIVSMVITYGGLACPATFEIDGALLGATPTPVEFIHGEMLPYVEAIWNRITQTAQQMGRTLPASKRADAVRIRLELPTTPLPHVEMRQLTDEEYRQELLASDPRLADLTFTDETPDPPTAPPTKEADHE